MYIVLNLIYSLKDMISYMYRLKTLKLHELNNILK